MTIAQAKAAGYRVVRASAIEVGLIHRGRGLRTWWAGEFNNKLPSLSHPRIQEAIKWNEDMIKERKQ